MTKRKYLVGETYVDWRAVEQQAWKAFCEDPQIQPTGLPETYRGVTISRTEYYEDGCVTETSFPYLPVVWKP